MTNDSDHLLSAYVDGQATAEEIALVEGDPALMAEAEAMAAVVDRLATELPTPPVGLPQTQIASALAAFDELALDGGAVVSDLGAHRTDRARAASRPSQVGRRRGGMPAWLGAAAAGLVAIAGVGWVLQTVGTSSDDSVDTATAEFDTSETDDYDADSELTTENLDRANGEGSAAEEAADPSADAAEYAESGPSDEAQDDEGTVATTTAPVASTTTGFFPDEEAAKARDAARQSLAAVPSEADLEEITSGTLLGPALSLCGSQLEPELGRSLIGFVPISVGDRQGEVLVYTGDDGSGRSLVVVSTEPTGGLPGCEPLE